jgi:protein TonB
MVLVGAIVLHVILIWGFAAGLGHELVKFVAPPLDVSTIDEAKVDEEPPPPPPPELERPPVQVVAPEITINLTPDAPPPPISVVTTRPVITQAPPPAPVAVVPDTVLRPISIPNPEDMYPSAAKQAGQEGVVRVKICISEASKIDSVEVGETSGFPLLDDAGVRVAKGGRFRAATKAGKPMSSCANLPIRFSLKK